MRSRRPPAQPNERIDVPTGGLPEYKVFVRHVWTYEDPDVGRVIGCPPFVFEAFLVPPFEGVMLVTETRKTMRYLDMDQHRIEMDDITNDGEPTLRVRFRDLEALYLFIATVANHSDHNERLASIGRVLLWTLGFRWI